jgi:hypothetical protein
MNPEISKLASLKLVRKLQQLNDEKQEELSRAAIRHSGDGPAVLARTGIEVKYVELACKACADTYTGVIEAANVQLTRRDVDEIIVHVKQIAETRRGVLTKTPRTASTPPNFSAVARNVAQKIEGIVCGLSKIC